MKISKKAIIVILLIIIIGIIIGTYFLLKNKKSLSNQSLIIPTRTFIPNGPNTVGFCNAVTIDGVDRPIEFRSVEHTETGTMIFDVADNGDMANDIQYKWVYDPTNSLNISRPITNESNAYSPAELSALGKTDKPGNYLVNKIITIYDKNDPKYKKGFYVLNPYILTTMTNCK
jgi:hypothetical protein